MGKKFVLGLTKSVLVLLTFFVTLFVAGKVMNSDKDNQTTQMAQASFPLVYMNCDGIAYNELHGYAQAMDVSAQRESITPLDESRALSFYVEVYDNVVREITYELRTVSGERLIEAGTLSAYATTGGNVSGTLTFKDLLEEDTEYQLLLCISTLDHDAIYYYTRLLYGSYYTETFLSFALDFHEKTFDAAQASQLSTYMETNSRLEDNASYAQVNINSSISQLSFGQMEVTQVGESVLEIKEIADNTATVLVRSLIFTTEEDVTTYYTLVEYFRLRYTSGRMYLLDYARTQTQLFNEATICGEDGLLLGIRDSQVTFAESDSGNFLAFVSGGWLCVLDQSSGKLSKIYGYVNEENLDNRTLYDAHAIQILNIDETGNVDFAVYGYFNRGEHEGQVGILVYTYYADIHMVEEQIFMPVDTSPTNLISQMADLLYLNDAGKLYLILESNLFCIDIEGQTYEILRTFLTDEAWYVSADYHLITWQETENVLLLYNLETDEKTLISVSESEIILPLGLIGEDVIYGVAKSADRVLKGATLTYPMYKLCIVDEAGNLLKSYLQSGVYITDITIEESQILLELATLSNGVLTQTTSDQIMRSIQVSGTQNSIATLTDEVYKRLVYLKTKVSLDADTLLIRSAKEAAFEVEPVLELAYETDGKYLVYDAYGVCDRYYSLGSAIEAAYEAAGSVVSNEGVLLWQRTSRSTKNQIMAITAAEVTESKSALAVCLETILSYEGAGISVSAYLDQGLGVEEILQLGLSDAVLLDATGATLEELLYYVNMDYPLLCILGEADAVLITGFNETQVVVMDPKSGSLSKMSLTEATALCSESGNVFYTYIKMNF